MAKDKTSIIKREAENTEAVERARSVKVFVPPVDIYETDNDIFVEADMPGTEEKSIDITLEKDVLCIKAKVDLSEPQEMNLNYSEYETGDFQRSFTLSDAVDQDKIEASYKNGVLKLRLPKAEPAKPKKIEVKFN
jgi:HSP20 family molecular chaperone IbpA